MSIAVFASGSGSNFEAIVETSKREHWSVPISLLLTDRPTAKAQDRAKRLGIPHTLVDPTLFPTKQEYEQAILRMLVDKQIKWVVLAGYMRLIGETLLEPYKGRILNIHPSLLPAFPGINAIQQAFDYPVKISGVTVHWVDEGMDTGPIIAQRAVPIDEEDTIETYTHKIQQVEHELYPVVIKQLIDGKKAKKE